MSRSPSTLFNSTVSYCCLRCCSCCCPCCCRCCHRRCCCNCRCCLVISLSLKAPYIFDNCRTAGRTVGPIRSYWALHASPAPRTPVLQSSSSLVPGQSVCKEWSDLITLDRLDWPRLPVLDRRPTRRCFDTTFHQHHLVEIIIQSTVSNRKMLSDFFIPQFPFER